MVEIHGLTIVLTTECNAACRHCGQDCTGTGIKVFETEEVFSILRTLKEMTGIRAISVTGGEPLLYPEKVVSIFSYAGSMGFSGELVSNSLWAADSHEAGLLLKHLATAGVKKYVTSLDEYHQEHIPASHVRNAVNAAVEHGMEVVVKIVDSDGRLSMDEYAGLLYGTRRLPPEVRFKLMPPVAAGRGRFLEYSLPEKSEKVFTRLGGRCPSILRFPSITPSGSLYPCCGFGTGERFAGLFREEKLTSLLERMQRNLLFNLLASLGPGEIYTRAVGEEARVTARAFHSTCDICNFLFTQKNVTAAVCEMLHSIRDGLPGATGD